MNEKAPKNEIGVEVNYEANFEEIAQIIESLEGKLFRGETEFVTAVEMDEVNAEIKGLQKLQNEFGTMPVPQEINTSIAKLINIRDRVAEGSHSPVLLRHGRMVSVAEPWRRREELPESLFQHPQIRTTNSQV